MISHDSYQYYMTYFGCVIAIIITIIRIRSGEGVTITTKEFKIFQNRFLIGKYDLFTRNLCSKPHLIIHH